MQSHLGACPVHSVLSQGSGHYILCQLWGFPVTEGPGGQERSWTPGNFSKSDIWGEVPQVWSLTGTLVLLPGETNHLVMGF